MNRPKVAGAKKKSGLRVGWRKRARALLAEIGVETRNVVFPLEHGEVVECYYCMQSGEHRSFRLGEAYLAGPAHSPTDGSAHHICQAHLDGDAVVVETGHGRQEGTGEGK